MNIQSKPPVILLIDSKLLIQTNENSTTINANNSP